MKPPPLDIRQVIARHAAFELRPGAVINYGFGIPDAIAALVAARGETDRYFRTIEHGTYSGGLVIAFLGFVEIAQNARKVVFCGTLDAKGASQIQGGRLTIEKHGSLQKFVDHVEQITFSGGQAMIQGQEILHITERAVFRLAGGQLRIEEIAPGIDLHRDILNRVAFQSIVADDLKPMLRECFEP